MKISKDLIFVKGINYTLAYNYEINDLIIILNSLVSAIKDNDIKNILKTTTLYERSALVNHGVLIENYEQYEIKKFKYNKDFLNSSIGIKEVYFHLTQRCNLHCKYCYNKDNLNKPDKLSFNEICEIIDKLNEIQVSKIIFTGGEVLLRKDIIDIVKYCKKKNVKCEILTNASLL